MIAWGRDPGPEPQHSRLDEAIDRGFDPGEDQGGQLVATPGTPLSPRLVRWIHQGSDIGCEECGVRCDRCEDRMCSLWGPEPRACGTTCVECPCECSACAEAAQDRDDERRFEIARDERWGA